jgi:DNA-binding IscR family transcriptional regulator
LNLSREWVDPYSEIDQALPHTRNKFGYDGVCITAVVVPNRWDGGTMSANSTMTTAVHVLTWIAFDPAAPTMRAVPHRIVASVNTNSVVIRRCLGELRQAGLVRCSCNHGWASSRDATKITLREVYGSVGGNVFALHASSPNYQCHVGCGIQPVLVGAYERLGGTAAKAAASCSPSEFQGAP